MFFFKKKKRFKVVYEKINLDRLIQFIIRGRIDPTKPITIKTMYDAGIFRKIKHGVKILGGGASSLKIPLHIEATAVSESAKKAILDAGGTIKRIYFNKVYLRYYLQVFPIFCSLFFFLTYLFISLKNIFFQFEGP